MGRQWSRHNASLEDIKRCRKEILGNYPNATDIFFDEYLVDTHQNDYGCSANKFYYGAVMETKDGRFQATTAYGRIGEHLENRKAFGGLKAFDEGVFNNFDSAKAKLNVKLNKKKRGKTCRKCKTRQGYSPFAPKHAETFNAKESFSSKLARYGAEEFLPNGVLRYYGKTVKEGQEGMFKGAEVKIIKIQEVKKHGVPSVIIYEYLDEEGNPLEIKGRFGMETRDSTTIKDFMINFTPFEPVNPIEYGAEDCEHFWAEHEEESHDERYGDGKRVINKKNKEKGVLKVTERPVIYSGVNMGISTSYEVYYDKGTHFYTDNFTTLMRKFTPIDDEKNAENFEAESEGLYSKGEMEEFAKMKKERGNSTDPKQCSNCGGTTRWPVGEYVVCITCMKPLYSLSGKEYADAQPHWTGRKSWRNQFNADELSPEIFGKLVGQYPQPPNNPSPVGGFMDNGFEWTVNQAEEFGASSIVSKVKHNWLNTLIGLGVALVGYDYLKKKTFNSDTLIEGPNTGDLTPADYEEIVVESTGYVVPIIPIGLDGSFMGSRFHALATDRYVYDSPEGIGTHIDIAINTNTDYLPNEMSLVQASEAPGQSPYNSILPNGQENKDFPLRVIHETTTVSLDAGVASYIPTDLSGYTGQQFVPTSVYENMLGIGISGQTPIFKTPITQELGANHLGSRIANPDMLTNVGGPLKESVNGDYTDGNKTMSLSQWSVENQVQQTSDTEAIVIERGSGLRKMIRRV